MDWRIVRLDGAGVNGEVDTKTFGFVLDSLFDSEQNGCLLSTNLPQGCSNVPTR
jgi:hypothetical protein